MERKRELTKILLAESFKELLIKGSFDKITIKMITDDGIASGDGGFSAYP